MPLNIPSRSYGAADSDTSGDIERRLRELETFVFQDLRRLLLARKGLMKVEPDGGVSISGFEVSAGGVVTLASLATDPTSSANGDIYYNTTLNKFRGFQNGSWQNLI